jgi:P2 family phage contractile tail tube protein
VNLPKLSRKLEEYRGGGMNIPVELDFGMQKMEAEIKAAGWFSNLINTFGSPRADAMLMRFTGAVQQDDTGETQAVEAVMRGRFSELDPGKAQSGDKTEQTYKLAVSYYKLTIAGKLMLEIDAVNLVEIVNGEDRLADVRAALGV